MSKSQITMGELISALSKAGPDKRVYYDWLNAVPTVFNSYRGYYEDVALGVTCERGNSKTVSELLSEARLNIGAMMEGYKGGFYKITEKKPLWVANYGVATGWGIVGIVEDENQIILKTENIDP